MQAAIPSALLLQRCDPARKVLAATPRDAVRSVGGTVFRFQDGGLLEEVTVQAEALHLGTVTVPFRDLAAFVRANDAAAFERAGFLVSPLYGIAFVPGEPCWVTALARHCLGEWEALRDGP